jgi:hypothetical protein
MPRWEVPYESADRTFARYIFATVFTLAAFGPLGVIAAENPGSPVGWIAGLLLATLFITVAWRVSMVGVWIGDRGVRVSTVARTRVVPWADLDRVWLAPAANYDALALWISLRDGTELETPIWRAGSPAIHRNRTKLRQDELSALVERLRAEAGRNP